LIVCLALCCILWPVSRKDFISPTSASLRLIGHIVCHTARHEYGWAVLVQFTLLFCTGLSSPSLCVSPVPRQHLMVVRRGAVGRSNLWTCLINTHWFLVTCVICMFFSFYPPAGFWWRTAHGLEVCAESMPHPQHAQGHACQRLLLLSNAFNSICPPTSYRSVYIPITCGQPHMEWCPPLS
jgi:hypothetical protein